MVAVAQLVEPWIVIPVVVGSSPIVHPIPIGASGRAVSSMVEQLTLNQLVVSSSLTRPTNYTENGERDAFTSPFFLPIIKALKIGNLPAVVLVCAQP